MTSSWTVTATILPPADVTLPRFLILRISMHHTFGRTQSLSQKQMSYQNKTQVHENDPQSTSISEHILVIVVSGDDLSLIRRHNTHYNDVMMSAMESQVTSLAIVYSNVYPGADERKHQSSASLAFVRGIHGLEQDCSNSIANALELLQSCTKPSTRFSILDHHWFR